MPYRVYFFLHIRGPLAQLAEHLVDVEKVTGSSPVLPTHETGDLRSRLFLIFTHCSTYLDSSQQNAIVRRIERQASGIIIQSAVYLICAGLFGQCEWQFCPQRVMWHPVL